MQAKYRKDLAQCCIVDSVIIIPVAKTGPPASHSLSGSSVEGSRIKESCCRVGKRVGEREVGRRAMQLGWRCASFEPVPLAKFRVVPTGEEDRQSKATTINFVNCVSIL